MAFPDTNRLESAYQTALAALLAERNSEGYWTGELSTSALSTATAVSALSLISKLSTQHSALSTDCSPLPTPHSPLPTLVLNGLAWLAHNQNPDGGWGDTVKSISNISTTMLCRAAFYIAGTVEQCRTELIPFYSDCLQRVEAISATVTARRPKNRPRPSGHATARIAPSPSPF